MGGQRSGNKNERKSGTKNGRSSNVVRRKRQEAAEVKRLSFSVEVTWMDRIR